MCPYRITLFITSQTPAHQATSKSNFKYLYKQNMNTKEHALAFAEGRSMKLEAHETERLKVRQSGEKKKEELLIVSQAGVTDFNLPLLLYSLVPYRQLNGLLGFVRVIWALVNL